MKFLRRLQLILWIAAFVIAGFTTVADAQIELKPEYYIVQNFQLKSGEILKEMKVEFAAFGTPRRDSAGNIMNALVFCHGGSGNYSQINLTKNVFGPGKPVNSDKYFFICPTALGSPGSSCPSVSGLGPKFPKYTVADMISAQYRLLTEHFKIKHLAGVMGASMGGMQTLQWITQYPDFMDWAIPIATTAEFKGRNVGIFGLQSYAIKNDPAYQEGYYKDQPRKGLDLGFMGVYLWYFTPALYKAQYKTNEDLLKGLKDAGLGSAQMDANDIIWRNEAMMTFSVKGELPKVKARTLVIGVNTDEIFPPEDEFIPIAKSIPGAKLFAFDSILGHVGCAVEMSKAGEAISKFLNQKD